MAESKTDEKENGKKPFSKLGLTPEQAAAASIAQSLAFAAQNEVDAFRNQNTVSLVATGSAYAKWLENPMMSEPYRDVIKSASIKNVDLSSTVKPGHLSVNSNDDMQLKTMAGLRPSSPSEGATNTSILKFFLGRPD